MWNHLNIKYDITIHFLAFIKKNNASWAETVVSQLNSIQHVLFSDPWNEGFSFEDWISSLSLKPKMWKNTLKKKCFKTEVFKAIAFSGYATKNPELGGSFTCKSIEE